MLCYVDQCYGDLGFDMPFNPFKNGNVLVESKLKAFEDNKFNMARVMRFIVDRVENIVGKEENAGYQHFLLFPQCFQKL